MKNNSRHYYVKYFKLILFIGLACLAVCCYDAQNLYVISIDSDISGNDIVYNVPESFIFDETSGYYFISNVNGGARELDDNGYIIKLDSALYLIDNYFIDGRSENYVLNAPRGMTIVDSTLFVTDLTYLRGFNLYSGQHIIDIDFSQYQPRFLNDLTSDKAGNIYVSDMLAGKLFKLDREFNITELDSPESPNGLYCDGDSGLIIANWEPPKIVRYHFGQTMETVLADTAFVNLDGIVIDEKGRLIFSDFTDGKVYSYDNKTDSLAVILKNLKNPADLSVDFINDFILIPQSGAGAIIYILNAGGEI